MLSAWRKRKNKDSPAYVPIRFSLFDSAASVRQAGSTKIWGDIVEPMNNYDLGFQFRVCLLLLAEILENGCL